MLPEAAMLNALDDIRTYASKSTFDGPNIHEGTFIHHKSEHVCICKEVNQCLSWNKS